MNITLWDKWWQHRKSVVNDKCQHEGTYSCRGDAGYCTKCGQEDSVFGVWFWEGKAKPIVERYYRDGLTHDEVDKEFDLIGGANKWRRELRR